MTAIPATLRLRREGALRARAARGDAVAFAAVYERHHQALYRYCRSILRHEQDAQDALQNTFTRAFAALQDERRDFELRPWLFRIAHNEAVSILRRRPTTDELADVVDARAFEDHIAEREELRLLQLDLADLPERQRSALVLRELNGLSHAEIGVVLELSPAAVKQAIFEARSALFSCREGREMECHDVRRLLSDGDGRILRGRGIRAHLRSCPGCSRFRSDLEQRPHALKALVPPLPVGAAAALLAELLGAGTAAKLLACVAIVGGGGATLAGELRGARTPAPVAETVRAEPRPERRPPGRPVPVPAVATSEPQPVVTVVPRSGRPSPTETARREPRRERPARERRQRPAPTSKAEPKPTPRATPAAGRGSPRPPQSQSGQDAPKQATPRKAKPQKTLPAKSQKDKPKHAPAKARKDKPKHAPPPAATSPPSVNSPRSERASSGAESPGRGPEVRAEKLETVPPGQTKKADAGD